MATDSAVRSVHNTLSTTVADTITNTQIWPAVEIVNGDATESLYVRQDGTTAVAAADGTTHILPGTTKVIKSEPDFSANTLTISVVGNGNIYSIEGVQ